MIATFQFFAEIIVSYDIKRYRQYGGAYELVAVVHFTNNSSLHIRDYVFIDGSRKYAFHWQDQDQNLICRWDNTEHYPHLATFPFHVHTPSSVDESPPMTLYKVLDYIKTHSSAE
jgi:hypothetical protein